MASHHLSSSSSDDGDENGRAPAAAARRDDNSISFRHFLQQQASADVIPTRNPRRPPPARSGSHPTTVPIDLVDLPGLLPDFVQDHLVVEAQNAGDHPHENHPIPNPVSPLDLALINEMMPNLLNSSQRHSDNANANAEAAGSDELGAYGPVASGSGPSLPDFLSDAQASSGRFIPARCSTGSLGRSLRGSAHNTDALLQQIQRLEHELQERDRRILELENVIFEQKAELVGLYEQMAQENDLEPEGTKPPTARNLGEGHVGAATSNSTTIGHSIPRPSEPRRVQEIVTRAELLLVELLKEIRQLKEGD